ncbi:hypothetical protein ACOSP7_009430 [Xanthoceras sorbifolium]
MVCDNPTPTESSHSLNNGIPTSYSKSEFIFISSSDEEKSYKKVSDRATTDSSQPLSSDDEEYVPRAEVDSHQTMGTDLPYEDIDIFHTSEQESAGYDSNLDDDQLSNAVSF